MADITLICEACGKNFKVSEYVEEPIACPQCGMTVGKSVASAETSRLHLASMTGRASLVSPTILPDLPSTPAATLAGPASSSRKQEARRRRGERRLLLFYILAWLLFGVLLAALLSWQWMGLRDAHWLKLYLNGRWILAALAWLLVLLPAFGDTWLQGLLCLLVPPYSVYYALNRLDHFYLRAIFFAVMLNLAAEYYFLPKEALGSILQEQITLWTIQVRGLIEHAGRSNVTAY